MAKQSTPAATVETEKQANKGNSTAEGQTLQGHEHPQPGTGNETGATSGPENDKDQGDAMRMTVAEQVLVVSAPGGPRRRAGFAFGPVPVDLRWDDLGQTDEERKDVLERLRADPLLKIDGRLEEHPADD